MSTDELITRAKRDVDLAAFLAEQGGWTPAPNDGEKWRLLDGPNGQRVLIHRAKSSQDWLWKDAATGEGGNIYHACTRLLGMAAGKAMAAIRKAVAAPPPALAVGRGGRPSESVNTPAEPRPPRTLAPLTEAAAEFLTKTRCLNQATVEAFAHRLRADPRAGHLVCPHNNDGDGEEYWPRADGSTRKHFHGSRDDGADRGRSLWYALPHPSEPIRYILVAESAVDAMSAWQKLDPERQRCTMIVSSAGSFSEAGHEKLSALIQQECRRAGGELTLVDASDVGEATTKTREGTLAALAASRDAIYERWATPLGKDWNDAVVADRRAQEAQAAALAAQYQLAPEEAAAEEEQGHSH